MSPARELLRKKLLLDDFKAKMVEMTTPDPQCQDESTERIKVYMSSTPRPPSPERRPRQPDVREPDGAFEERGRTRERVQLAWNNLATKLSDSPELHARLNQACVKSCQASPEPTRRDRSPSERRGRTKERAIAWTPPIGQYKQSPEQRGRGREKVIHATTKEVRGRSAVVRHARSISGTKLAPAAAGAAIQRSMSPSILEDFSRYPQSDQDGDEKKGPHTSTRSLGYTDSPPPPYFSRDASSQRELLSSRRSSISTHTPFLGAEDSLIMYDGDVEEDDDFHRPHPIDEKRDIWLLRDGCNVRSCMLMMGTALFILGFLGFFIAIPILTLTTDYLNFYNHAYPPLHQDAPKHDPNYTYIDYGPKWAHVNNRSYPLLQRVRRGLVDPDTPLSERRRTSMHDGSTLNLVYSDEFNVNGRTFFPGDDPFWTGQDLWYAGTMDLEWYDPDAITTGNGTLQIKFDKFKNHGLDFRSGMLNSWNKTCVSYWVL